MEMRKDIFTNLKNVSKVNESDKGNFFSTKLKSKIYNYFLKKIFLFKPKVTSPEILDNELEESPVLLITGNDENYNQIQNNKSISHFNFTEFVEKVQTSYDHVVQHFSDRIKASEYPIIMKTLIFSTLSIIAIISLYISSKCNIIY